MKQDMNQYCRVSTRYLDPSKRWPSMVVRVSREVMASLEAMQTSNSHSEQVGILGMHKKEGVLTHFFLDEDAHCTCTTVQPAAQRLTEVAQKWAKEDGVLFAGLVHTHCTGVESLSRHDLEYARRLLDGTPWMKHMLMVVVTAKKIIFYALDKGAQIPSERGNTK